MSGEGWYTQIDGAIQGPMSTAQLLELHSNGKIGETTLVSRDKTDWMEAGLLPGFSSGPSTGAVPRPGQSHAVPSVLEAEVIMEPNAARPSSQKLQTLRASENPCRSQENGHAYPPPPPLPRADHSGLDSQKPAAASSDWLRSGKRQASVIVTDLREMDFRKEIIPIDETNLGKLVKDGIFWFATLLGVVPLAIVTLPTGDAQLTAFAMFFAAVWGAIFRSAILKDKTPWGMLLASLLFTGLIGTTAATKIEGVLVSAVPLTHPGLVTLLVVFVLFVGAVEESCKLVPVVAYVLWRRKAAQPMTAVLIGVFSGLGFAAFENLIYSDQAIASTLAATRAAGEEGLAVGVQSAMTTAMLRSLSLVFCHAVWAGIFAYFLAAASLSGKRWGAMLLVGFVLTAVLHGVYDWLVFVQQTLAALTAGLSFILFYGYVAKIRRAVEDVKPCPNSLPSDAG